jgi:FkbM family methyltransferase
MSHERIVVFNSLLEKLFRSRHAPKIVEIGAADGADTVKLLEMACQFSSSGRCKFFAFEPDPRNLDRFAKRKELSEVVLVPKAVSDQDGEATFYLSSGRNPNWEGDWSLSNSLMRPTGHYNRYPWVQFPEEVTVPTIMLDTFFYEKIPIAFPIDFIWCDINGAERQMIRGGWQTLQRTRYLYTEFGEGLFENQASLWDIAQLLPGWKPIFTMDNDVLLENQNHIKGQGGPWHSISA